MLADEDLRSLSGLFLHCGVAGSRFIRRSQLDLIGEQAVLANASGKRMTPCALPLFRRALSPDGRRIGAITDAIIDERTMGVRALELSRGYLDDLTGGRECIRQFMVQKNGDVIVGIPEGGNPS